MAQDNAVMIIQWEIITQMDAGSIYGTYHNLMGNRKISEVVKGSITSKNQCTYSLF